MPDPHADETLEAMGCMAGRVAHDINNILAQVSGLADLCRIKRSDPAAIDDLADRMQETVTRARSLSDALNRCAQREPGGLIPTDLATTLRALQPAIAEQLGPDRPCDYEFTADAAVVLADPIGLNQAILALVTNAADASNAGDRVMLALSRGDGRAQLSCRDQGDGMDAATCAQACRPYFSTRGRARKGMGLALAYGVATRMGGRLSIASEPGAGTAVTLDLPLADPA